MSIFDSLSDIVSSVTGGNAQDVIGNVTEQLPVDEITNIQESVSDVASNAGDSATNAVDDIKNSLGL